MAGARREGLRIEYARCDVTDRAQVRELIRREDALAGGRLAGVVHNAGVDTAARLPKKTDEEILRTVEVKIEGFRNLFEEVRDRDLKFWCGVGSLTGRLGGMVGQLEYAAANDGLARLGRWAARRAAFPVMTLAWPTWDRIGLISNFAATLRYMAAIDVADGLERWRAELLAGSEGEITFVGPLGRAIDPGQAVGYPVVPALPGFATAHPKIFHLGEVTAYQPHARLTARVVFDPPTHPRAGRLPYRRRPRAAALPPAGERPAGRRMDRPGGLPRAAGRSAGEDRGVAAAPGRPRDPAGPRGPRLPRGTRLDRGGPLPP
ncbi:SDR family NAD(P)-dependent oxidoreductase [Streptomyces malaysiensis]